MANRKMLWLIIKILEKHTNLKKQNYPKILSYYGNTNIVREKYLSKVRDSLK